MVVGAFSGGVLNLEVFQMSPMLFVADHDLFPRNLSLSVAGSI